MLIQELLALREAEKVSVADLFDENSDKVARYQKKQLIDARPAEAGETIHVTFPEQPRGPKKAHEGDYVVRLKDDIKKVGILSGEDFAGTYEQTATSQKPDAEGFVTYRETGEYEAYQHEGEAVTFNGEWGKQTAVNGDFIVRAVGFDDAGFVVKPGDFKTTYVKG